MLSDSNLLRSLNTIKSGLIYRIALGAKGPGTTVRMIQLSSDQTAKSPQLTPHYELQDQTQLHLTLNTLCKHQAQ